MNILLHIIFNICFVCSKEPSWRDGSFEYLWHSMFWFDPHLSEQVLLHPPPPNQKGYSADFVMYMYMAMIGLTLGTAFA